MNMEAQTAQITPGTAAVEPHYSWALMGLQHLPRLVRLRREYRVCSAESRLRFQRAEVDGKTVLSGAKSHNLCAEIRYIGIGSIGCGGSSGGQGVRDRVQLRLGLLRSLKRDCGKIHINLIGNNTRLL